MIVMECAVCHEDVLAYEGYVQDPPGTLRAVRHFMVGDLYCDGSYRDEAGRDIPDAGELAEMSEAIYAASDEDTE